MRNRLIVTVTSHFHSYFVSQQKYLGTIFENSLTFRKSLQIFNIYKFRFRKSKEFRKFWFCGITLEKNKNYSVYTSKAWTKILNILISEIFTVFIKKQQQIKYYLNLILSSSCEPMVYGMYCELNVLLYPKWSINGENKCKAFVYSEWETCKNE